MALVEHSRNQAEGAGDLNRVAFILRFDYAQRAEKCSATTSDSKCPLRVIVKKNKNLNLETQRDLATMALVEHSRNQAEGAGDLNRVAFILRFDYAQRAEKCSATTSDSKCPLRVIVKKNKNLNLETQRDLATMALVEHSRNQAGEAGYLKPRRFYPAFRICSTSGKMLRYYFGF